MTELRGSKMIRQVSPFLLLAVAGVTVAATPRPSLLGKAAGGEWSVSRSADGSNPVKLCVAHPGALARWEHRGEACGQVELSARGNETVANYSCPAGDFGHSKISVITPRSLRIDTQGIHRGEPFFYQLHARRTGNC